MIRRKKRLRRKAPRSFRPKPLAQDCPKSSGFFFVRAARAVRYFSCFAPVWPLARDCPKSSGFFFARAARAVRYFLCFAPVWPLARDCPKSSVFFCARGAGCPPATAVKPHIPSARHGRQTAHPIRPIAAPDAASPGLNYSPKTKPCKIVKKKPSHFYFNPIVLASGNANRLDHDDTALPQMRLFYF